MRLAERDAGVLDGVVRARLEVALHAHVEVEQPVPRHGVEQVVEEADARLALARARAVQVQRELDVGLARGAVDLRGAAHARRSIDSACTGKPSARARAAPAGARRAGASPGKDTRAMRRRKVAGESADWKRAAPPGGQHVVRAGHVVAERGGGAAPTNRQPARAHAVGERLRLVPHELEVLGRDLLRDAQRVADARARRSAAARRRDARTLAARAARPPPTTASSSSRVRARAATAGCPRRARPAPAGRARSAPGPRPRRRPPPTARSAPRCRRSPPASTPPGAWPPARTGCRGPTITSTRSHRLGAVRERGDRLGATHPVHLVHLAQHAGGEDHRVRAAARPGRRADDDLLHARGARRHGAHHHRRRVGRPAARHVDRRAPHRHARRSPPGGPAGSSTAAGSRSCALATARTFAIAVRRPSSTSGSSTPTDASSSCESTRSCSGPELGAVEALGEARARRRRRPRRTSSRISRTASLDAGRTAARASSRSRCAVDPHAAHPLRRSRRSAPPSACAPPGWRSGAPCRWRSAPSRARLFSASVLPAGREVHDAVDEAGERRQLDRALHLHDLGLAPGRREVLRRHARVLGRDPDAAEAAQRVGDRVAAGRAPPRPSRSGRSRGRAARRPCGSTARAARPCR